jgi:hypothetical protein
VTAPQDRDHLLDHTLKHGLNSAAAWSAESECLDAETLAAWADGGLDRQQAALTETHLSNCGQCQELLAALTQTLPATGTKATSATTHWRWWMVPMTAAAAVALWMVVPNQRYLAVPDEPAAELAQGSPPVAQEPIAAAPATPVPVPAPPPAATAPAATPRPAATQPARERARADDLRKPAPAQEFLDAAERTAPPAPLPAPQAMVAGRDAAAESKVAAPPAATSTGAAAANRAAAAPAPAPAPPSSPPVVNPAAEPPFVTAPAPAAATGAEAATQVVSPDSRFRWRYSAAGLDYSSNGGSTWEQVSAAIGRFITAGASPAPTVCWLVARGGSVYVTVDGRNFFRARFPEITNLTGVTATSGTAATVTTADGRTFVTSDGGATWRRQ